MVNKMCLKKIYTKTFGFAGFLSRELKTGWKIIDVGCGKNSPLKDVSKKLYKVGLDYYPEYIKKAKIKSIHQKYICQNINEINLKNNSFDAAISIEVIEHLTKKQGLKLIKNMNNAAKYKIILTTPNGFLPTYAGSEDNPQETHVSGWETKDFKKLGFNVKGVNGFKFFWTIDKGNAVIKSPRIIFLPLKLLTEPISILFPKYAFQLFCVKKLNKNIKKK